MSKILWLALGNFAIGPMWSRIALLFTSRFISPRLCERLGKKYCSRKNGSGERDTDQVTRVRSLKPSRGNAKHVTVLKESERSELRKVHKACPYSARYKARTHVPSNLLFRYSLVSSSMLPLFSGLPSCIPNRCLLSSSLLFSLSLPRVPCESRG